MNANNVLAMDYGKLDTWSIGKNEPKTNPNEPKTNPISANKTPIRTQFKPKQTQYKPNSNPNKPNFKGEKPDFSLEKSKVNFKTQRIDGSVQICYMAETVFFVNFSSCSYFGDKGNEDSLYKWTFDSSYACGRLL